MEHKGLRYLIGLLSLVLFMALPAGTFRARADETETDEILPNEFAEQLTGLGEIVHTYEDVDASIDEVLTASEYDRFTDSAIGRSTGMPLLMAGEPEPDGGGTAYYDMLTDGQKGVYTALKNGVASYVNSEAYATDITEATAVIECSGKTRTKLTNDDLDKAFEAFYRDNTKYYFLKAGYSSTSYNDGFVIKAYVINEYYSKDLRDEVDEAVETVTQEWLTQLQAIMADSSAEPDATKREYLTALRLHDLIIDRINYAYDSSGSPENKKFAHSIAGVCTGEGVVCEGYADMFSYLLNLLGIDNMIVTGRGASESHAWNTIKLGDEYYLVDVTWDDANPKSKSDYRGDSYEYFCMPVNLFKKQHTPDKRWNYPAFSSKTDYAFVYYFQSFTDEVMNEDEAKTFRDTALAHQYKGCDYVYFTLPMDSFSAMSKALGGSGFSYSTTEYGYTIKYLCPKIEVPSKTVSLHFEDDTPDAGAVATEAAIEVKGTVSFAATIAAGSDDRIAWSVSDTKIAKLTTNGKSVTVTGRRNGTVTLTAQTYAGGAVATCTIVVGTGTSSADFYVWAGGTADKKKVKITPTITATNWKDSRGKDKTGKLVWMTSDEDIEIKFDTTKHTVKTKVSSKKRLSVNSKGEITAKKPGRAYVYICDTGSCTYESYSVEVLGAPSKLYLSNKPESTAKSDLVKKVGLDVLSMGKVYIVPYLKDFDVDVDCTYSVEVKEEQKKYVSLSGVAPDDDGNPYFTVTAKDYSHEENRAAKPVSVKITATNKESNKKASMTVAIGNPTASVSATPKTTGTLAKKNDTVEFNLSVLSKMGASYETTDTIKIYVGKTSVALDSAGKKITADRGATVKVTMSKDKKSFTVKASKDAGTTAVVTLALKDSVTKQYTLYELFRVDEEGNILR